MKAYAIVGYLDYETDEYIKNLWKVLSEKDITRYGVEAKGKRPHITLADYENIDKAEFIKLFNNYYKDKIKVDINLNVLGTFINTGTLFLSPTLSDKLFNFHKNHHNYFKEFDLNDRSLYLPGNWIPHCTIASRLSEENMIRAFRYCKSTIKKVIGKLEEIAFIEIELNDEGIAIKDKVICSVELG